MKQQMCGWFFQNRSRGLWKMLSVCDISIKFFFRHISFSGWIYNIICSNWEGLFFHDKRVRTGLVVVFCVWYFISGSSSAFDGLQLQQLKLWVAAELTELIAQIEIPKLPPSYLKGNKSPFIQKRAFYSKLTLIWPCCRCWFVFFETEIHMWTFSKWDFWVCWQLLDSQRWIRLM